MVVVDRTVGSTARVDIVRGSGLFRARRVMCSWAIFSVGID